MRTSRGQSLCAKIRGKNLQQERCARREAWNLAKISISPKTIIKTTFYLRTEAWVMPALVEKARRARIRGRFRSVDAHAEQKGCKLRRSGNPSKHNCSNYQCRSGNKRGSTIIRSRSWSLRDGEITRWHACSSIAWKTLRRARLSTRVGQRSKATSSQVRLLHRHRRTHQVLLWVQQFFNVTKRYRGTGAIHYNPKTNVKNKDDQRGSGKPPARPPRVVEGVLQTIWRKQKSQQPQTFHRTQIRNVLLKWQQGSTVLRFTFQKTEIVKSASEPRWQGLFAEREMAKLCLVQKKFGDMITADHKVFSEGCESRNNHR